MTDFQKYCNKYNVDLNLLLTTGELKFHEVKYYSDMSNNIYYIFILGYNKLLSIMVCVKYDKHMEFNIVEYPSESINLNIIHLEYVDFSNFKESMYNNVNFFELQMLNKKFIRQRKIKKI